MWTDLLAAIWPALPMFFFAGLCFVLAGTIWLVAIRRHEVALGPDPVIPAVHQQPFRVPSPPAPANYRRPDSDTAVVPRIPGATPPLSPQLAAVARMLDAVDRDATVPLTPIDGLREERIEASPFATEPTPSPVRDDCPLTTQDLVIPTDGDTPVHREIADREPTQELSGRVAKILEGSK